jgi:outer membrane protein assembly factor BamA
MRKYLICFITTFIFYQGFTQEKILIGNITIVGNKITKEAIILREITFKKGDFLSQTEIDIKTKQSKENLVNLNLYNFVDISSENSGRKTNIIIEVVERWYIWPYPILELSERNFNVWWDEFKESKYSDFSRMNYGVYLVWENFRGKKELLKLKYRKGFKEHYLFKYEIPYFNKEKTIGISAFAQHFRRKKSFYNTMNNKLLYYENGDKYTTKDSEFQINILYRKNTRHKHKLRLNYLQSNIADPIKSYNPDYLKNEKLKGDYFQITYQYANEQRDYVTYPLHGHYLHFQLTKNFEGSSPVNHFEVMGKVEKYMEISNRLFIGSSFKAKVSPNDHQPYFAQKGLGFDDYVRTYEYYVVDGQNYWLSKTAIKYTLIEKTHFDIPYLKMSQFKKAHYSLYFSVFSDLGYVVDRQNSANNNLANQLLFGRGVSLDYVTYYDKILRIEYGINRLGEKGIFLHFTNPF